MMEDQIIDESVMDEGDESVMDEGDESVMDEEEEPVGIRVENFPKFKFWDEADEAVGGLGSLRPDMMQDQNIGLDTYWVKRYYKRGGWRI